MVGLVGVRLVFDPGAAAREIHPHSAYSEHERERQAEGDVRAQEHQGHWAPLRQHRAQAGRRGAQPEVGGLAKE